MNKKFDDVPIKVIKMLDDWAKENDICMSCVHSNMAAILMAQAITRDCSKQEIERILDTGEIMHNMMVTMKFVLETSTELVNDILAEADRPTLH